MTGAELQARRRKLGFNQTKLARRWGVGRDTLSRWENAPGSLPGFVKDAMAEVERHPECQEELSYETV